MKLKEIQKLVIEWLEELSFAVIIAVILFTFVFKVVSVNGPSMLPTLVSEDKLVINCVNTSYETGDIIVITEVLETPIIKRIIATEGQTVDIADGMVFVDGTAIDDSLFGIENGITAEAYISSSAMEFPQTVPMGHVFVLGDNRTVSEDSRYTSVGMVDERKIIGKAVFRFMPFDTFGLID